MVSFEVCLVNDTRNLLKKKLLSNRPIEGEDIKEVLAEFEDYEEAQKFKEDTEEPTIIIEVFNGEQPQERTVCEECDFILHTHSSKRYTQVKKIHEKYHHESNIFEEDKETNNQKEIENQEDKTEESSKEEN